MFKTTLLKMFSTGFAIFALAGCGDSNSINWNRLNNVTDATSLQKAITVDDDKMSLVAAGLDQYRKLLQTRTTENQERAKVLYSRIQMHASSSVILAGDFNRLAELELLHLGWAKSLSPPYAQIMDNRVRAFDASSAIFRTTPVMRPTASSANEKRAFYYNSFDDALYRLNELCLVATNPWSLTSEQAVAPRLVERVQKMSTDLIESMQNVSVESGGKYSTYTPFADSVYAKAFAKVCLNKKSQPASVAKD